MGSAEEFDELVTEQRNRESIFLDRLSIEEMLDLICKEDQKVVEAVARERGSLAEAVRSASQALREGGRMFYMGSGTSGRLGVLDAAELLPTYGAGPETVKAILAGGPQAMFYPSEQAEDEYDGGRKDFLAESPGPKDVLVGITASGRTPYVLGALEAADEIGAMTVAITCNPDSAVAARAQVTIAPVVGPEVVSGSTRMKAGTAQKLVLNTLSTAVMVQLGKVYGNLMVGMQPSNEKLKKRAERIVAAAAEVDCSRAAETLAEADGDIKTAIVMLKSGRGRTQAQQALDAHEGFVGKALAALEEAEHN